MVRRITLTIPMLGPRHRSLVALLVAFGIAITATPAQAAAGDPDPTFGSGGTLVTGIAGVADALAEDPSTHDLLVVSAGGSNNNAVTITRFLPDGSIDSTFGSGGSFSMDLGASPEALGAIHVLSDGSSLVATGTSAAKSAFGLIKLTPSGSPDGAFGGGDGFASAKFGFGAAVPEAMLVYPKGRILLVGYATDGKSKRFALARFKPNGSPDGTFGSAGHVTTAFGNHNAEAFSVARASTGTIVVGGYRESPTFQQIAAIASYTSTGSPDTAFGGGDGRISNSTVPEVLVLRRLGSGKLLSAFTFGSPGGTFSHVGAITTRFRNDGSLDPTFGQGGQVLQISNAQFEHTPQMSFGSTTSDGSFVFEGVSAGSATTYLTIVTRVLPDGSFDPTFGYDGTATASLNEPFANGLASIVQSDANIVWAGSAGQGGSANDVSLARFLGA